MISKSEIVERVRKKRDKIERFLGYANRPVPKAISKKIDSELGIFSQYIEIEYEYELFEKGSERYVDIIYTIGPKLDELIKTYTDNFEAMRAIVADKIGIVTLDEIKAAVFEEIEKRSGFRTGAELYPGSREFPMEKQSEIYYSFKDLKTIKINGYHQLYPVKSVALRVKLGVEERLTNRCSGCEHGCSGQVTDEEAGLLYLRHKAKKTTKELYVRAGLSDTLYADNILDIEIWAEDYRKRFGGLGIEKRHLEWIDKILDLKIIKLGSLQFELLNFEDVDLQIQMNDKGDTIYADVHVRVGEDLSVQSLETSYLRALEYFKSKGMHFSRVCFICDSWLINKKLQDLLRPDSRIVAFQKDYEAISEDLENRQAEERVFGYLSDDYSVYPEETSLQRNLKSALLAGERFGTVKGVYVYEIW